VSNVELPQGVTSVCSKQQSVPYTLRTFQTAVNCVDASCSCVKVENGGGAKTIADVSGSSTGKCGLLPLHFHHRVNAAVVSLA